MPLYETVMQEKPPVVLDIGTAYTKLGFAAEAYPRKIIPSCAVLSATGKIRSIFDFDETIDFYDYLVDFLQVIFSKHLLISPKERKIVIVENVFGKTVVRESLARVLFVHFEVSSILFVPLHMIAISTLAVPNAVVIDIGHSETTILPVYSGVQILQAFKDHRCGGAAIQAEIKRQLLENNISEEYLTDSVLEDIKVRTCLVTTRERAFAYSSDTEKITPPPDIDYSINEYEIIWIPGKVRETAFEIMFEENNERDSLPHLIIQSILSCPIDIRNALIGNIFVIGGSSIMSGLLARLKADLEYLAKNDAVYKEQLHGDVIFKFHNTIGRENCTAWLGGSLCGATDLVQTRSLTKENYYRHRHVPDWICLNDNRLAG